MPDSASPRYEAARLHEEAVVRRTEGNVSGAFVRYKRVLELAEQAGERQCQAETLAEIGRMYQEAFNLLEAKRWHQQALELFRELELGAEISRTLGWLAEVAQLSGDPAQAETLFNEALSNSEAGEREDALLHAGLGQLLWECGRQPEGAAEMVKAFDALRKLGAPEAEQVRERVRDWKRRTGAVRHRQLIAAATPDPELRALLTT